MFLLDHDLCEDHYKNSNSYEKSGTEFSKVLSNLSQHYGKIVIIHSLNQNGRLNMKSILSSNFKVFTPENFKNSFVWQLDMAEILAMI